MFSLQLDTTGVIAGWSAAAQLAIGYGASEIVGRHFSSICRPAAALDASAAADPVPACGGGSTEGQHRLLHKSGAHIPAWVAIAALHDARGGILGFSVHACPNAGSPGVQDSLRKMVDAAPSGLAMLDGSGTLRLANLALGRMFGYARAEMSGMSIDQLVPGIWPGISAGRVDIEVAAPDSRAGAVPGAPFGLRRDGSRFPIALSLYHHDDADATGVIASIADLDDRCRMEAEVRQSKAELEQFAHIASHDLQEPLRKVASYTALLAQRYSGQLDDKAAKYIAYAVDGAKRMQGMIVDLTAYTRLGLRGGPMIPVAVDGVVTDVLRGLERQLQATGASVEREPLPLVLADADQLRQLFRILIGNAIKFRGAAPPQIRLTATMEANNCRFAVQDNGIGIEPQYAERIFQIFQRLHGIDEYEGSGMGLAIAKRIVERHGGRIWVESAPGAGSTFNFTLSSAPHGPEVIEERPAWMP